MTNVGQVPGRETVQVYVGDAPAPHGLKRPRRELRAFAGVHIDQGATAEVRLTLGAEGFRRWDPVQGGGVVDPGPYELAAGASSRDLRTRATVTIPEADGDRIEPATRLRRQAALIRTAERVGELPQVPEEERHAVLGAIDDAHAERAARLSDRPAL